MSQGDERRLDDTVEEVRELKTEILKEMGAFRAEVARLIESCKPCREDVARHSKLLWGNGVKGLSSRQDTTELLLGQLDHRLEALEKKEGSPPKKSEDDGASFLGLGVKTWAGIGVALGAFLSTFLGGLFQALHNAPQP